MISIHFEEIDRADTRISRFVSKFSTKQMHFLTKNQSNLLDPVEWDPIQSNTVVDQLEQDIFSVDIEQSLPNAYENKSINEIFERQIEPFAIVKLNFNVWSVL